MIVHLDTNRLVELSTRGSKLGARLIPWLQQNNRVATSAITWSEFCNGPLSREQKDAVTRVLDDHIIAFTAPMAERASILFNRLGRRRGSHPDCMIAATAILSECPLSTLNHRDFEPMQSFGLRLHSF